MKTMTTKEKISYGMAVGTLICGLVLLFMSFLAPPEGEINSSVLYAFGEISLFVGSIFGISVHVHALKGDLNKDSIDEAVNKFNKIKLKKDEENR